VILKCRWQRCKNACSDKLTTRTYEVRRKLYLLQHTNTILKSKPDKHKSHKRIYISSPIQLTCNTTPGSPPPAAPVHVASPPSFTRRNLVNRKPYVNPVNAPPANSISWRQITIQCRTTIPLPPPLRSACLALVLAFHLRREKMKLPLYCA
jgi:hypothetical protein